MRKYSSTHAQRSAAKTPTAIAKSQNTSALNNTLSSRKSEKALRSCISTTNNKKIFNADIILAHVQPVKCHNSAKSITNSTIYNLMRIFGCMIRITTKTTLDKKIYKLVPTYLLTNIQI